MGTPASSPRGADRVSKYDALAHAVYYPEIITIASVLASPHWQSAAADRATADNAYAEIARRLTTSAKIATASSRPDATPLTDWSEDLQLEANP